MGTSAVSIGLIVLGFGALVGCSEGFTASVARSPVQVGLANAPALGGATPETRVHDVISNGRDSCERAAFPQGETLRGEIPPCVQGEHQPLVPPMSSPPAVSRSVPGVVLANCPPPRSGVSTLPAITLSQSKRLLCNGLW